MAFDGSLKFDTLIDTAGFNTGTASMSKMATAAKVGIVAAIGACVAGLVSFAKSSIETGSKFDTAMSQVAATMGVTTDSCEELRDKAKEMGSTTAFTATEAAEGLNILAMAGYNATEQCEMIEPVLNLASAGATTLDNSASYLTTTLKGYCVTSEETGTMTEYYSDLMAKGATLVNTSVDELGQAMATSSATANAYGQTVETTTTALLALADGGITGSQAATYLTRTMTNLYAPTSTASAAMEELSDKTGVQITAYDEATGESRDFMDVIKDLQTALSGCTDQEAAHYKQTILGTVGLKSYNIIANKSADELDALTASLTDCTGAAKGMAETQLDNLEGDITLLNSAVDGLKISFYETFEGTLRSCVQFITNTVIPALEVVIDHLPEIIAALAGVAAAVVAYHVAQVASTAATSAATIADWLQVTAKLALSSACSVLAAAMNAIPFVAVAAAVGALVTATILLVKHFKDTDSEAAQLKDELSELEDEIDETKESYAEACDETEKTNESYKSMAKELEELTSREKLTRAEQERVNTICEEFQNAGLDITYDEIGNSIDKSAEELDVFVDGLSREGQYNDAVAEYNELAAERAELLEIQADAELIMNGETEANWQQVRKATDTYEEAQEQLESLDEEMNAAADVIEEMGSAMEETGYTVSATDEAIMASVDQLAATLSGLQTSYDDVYNSAYESMSGQFELWEQASEVAVTSMEDLQAALDSQQQYWEDLASNIELLSNSGIDGMDQLLASIDTTSTDGVNYIASLAAGLEDSSFDMESYVQQATEGLSGSWEAAATSVANSTTDFEGSVEEAMQQCISEINELDQGSEAHELAVNTLMGYIEGIDETGEEVDEEVVTVAEELVERFADELGTHSPSTVFQEFGQDTSEGYIMGLDGMAEEVSMKLSETTEAITLWSEESTLAAQEGTAGISEAVSMNFDQIPEAVSASTDTSLNEVNTWASNMTQSAQSGGSGVLSNITSFFSQIPGKISANTNSSMSNVSSWCSNMPSTVKSGASNVLTNISSYFSQIPGKIQTYTTTANNTVTTWSTNMVNKVKTAANNVLTNITSYFSQIPGKIQTYTNTAYNTVNTWCTNMLNAVKTAFSNMVSQVSSSMSSISSTVSSKLSSVVSTVNSYASSMSSAGYTLGQNIVQGMINGINNKSSSLYSTISSVVSTAVSKANSAAGTSSPSKYTTWTGEMIDEGLVVGLSKYSGLVEDAMEDVMSIMDMNNNKRVADYMPSLLSASENEMNAIVSRMQSAASREAEKSFEGFRLVGQMRADSGYAAGMSIDNHIDQTNNYYTQVASPAEVSRNQREAARKLVGGVA